MSVLSLNYSNTEIIKLLQGNKPFSVVRLGDTNEKADIIHIVMCSYKREFYLNKIK